jgi:antitoxin ChpS
MLSMPLRKQGGAAIVTIPPSVLKSLDLKVGAELRMDVRNGTLVIVPARPPRRKRYTLAQLLDGATPRAIKALHAATAWSREDGAVGRELA